MAQTDTATLTSGQIGALIAANENLANAKMKEARDGFFSHLPRISAIIDSLEAGGVTNDAAVRTAVSNIKSIELEAFGRFREKVDAAAQLIETNALYIAALANAKE